ncbi:hypothetical protein CHUAL_013820 [Chamberlinius hualienensis]
MDIYLSSKFTAEIDKLKKQLQEATDRYDDQKQLVTQLEDDLLKVNALSRGEGEGQVTPADFVVAEITSSKDFVFGSNAAESLLPIVSSQRERFRLRIQELETQSSSQQRQFNVLRGEVEKLREDNVKLYEKIRFLQVYTGTNNTNEGEMERSYLRQYESSLDPFTTFSRRERQTRRSNLSPIEQLTLGMGQLILSNKTARIVTFLYILLLHILVFGVIFKLAYNESWVRDISSNCAESYALHMQKAHGHTLDQKFVNRN